MLLLTPDHRYTVIDFSILYTSIRYVGSLKQSMDRQIIKSN